MHDVLLFNHLVFLSIANAIFGELFAYFTPLVAN